ncbi:MAG: NAD(P)H-hydrate dehydratase, partial [Bacteroidales bacterium]|nr:NAD(P)H-hydrate dehydratase [Bacteroidales bacterium]
GDLATKDLSAYTAVGVGPGMGTDEMAVQRLTALLGNKTIKGTFVIDADAINILSKMPQGMRSVYMPKNGIYTPHPKEFQRLFGTYKNDFERLEMQVRISVEFSIYIVYKVANTIITTPVGEAYINTSGNPGMATGGSGDVLTGIITGLAASGYSLKDACIIGVFMHGKAGDAAARALSMDAMVATDIIKYFDKR